MNKLTVDEYKNLISLLKQALLFYGDKENYTDRGKHKPILTRIEIDEGSQARFALDKIKELEELYLNTVEEFKNISELEAFEEFKNIKGNNEESWDDLLKQIKNIKNE